MKEPEWADDRLKQYLEMTGQTFQELMGGAFDYGMDFILNTLVPEALEKKERILWRTPKGQCDGSKYYFWKIPKRK